ncbi:peptidylprolyl isomerase [Sphingomonas sp. IC-11]|uniref:peptidylprolyl isomerase n=1 Tax=Sphingomonas sp. IC-11 TaxID=2898528 RepID=UPI001E4E45D3|nr:peptidylprolyl isomerase [Sphingomonas sp. IC-11]MCD2316762.1 peptidylprolyl isomerase [Sphingomonas sp. IC-11]
MRFVGMIAMLAALLAGPAMAQEKTPETQATATASKQRYTPPPTTDLENTWLLDLSSGGRVSIWLRPDVAPDMVRRIKNLTRRKFYDGLTFHRVIDGFMAQGGDPQGDGTGGSDLPDVKAEFNYLPHVRGAVAAARAQDENSANSQFYIMLMPRLSLDGKYTVFGRVLQGMQYVDAIEKGEPPANPTRILHAYIAADNPPPYQAAPVTPPPSLDAPATLPSAKPASNAKPAAKGKPRR